MNFNVLYYFKITAEFQHYTKAAKFLYITQPSLSRAISTLEEELGVPLFKKDGRNVQLTKYGDLLYSFISKGFQEIETGYQMLSQFKRKNSGIIDFGFLFVLGYHYIPALIRAFFTDPNRKNITVNFHQYNTVTCINKIKEGTIDLALCTFIPNEPEINFTPVLEHRMICITALDHPLANHETLSMEEIVPYPMISFPETAGEIQGFINQLFSNCSIKPNHFCTMGDEITMAGLVSTNHNNCLAIVPDLEVLDNLPIKKIPIDHPNAYRNIYLATSQHHLSVPCVKLFHDFILQFEKTTDEIRDILT
nr:LysR family transcriptional regulator [Lysinibacillus timonensis]